MKGNTLKEFIDDLLSVGGPEKEFAFNGRRFFLETTFDRQLGQFDMCIQEYLPDAEQTNLHEYHFEGKTETECVHKFEKAKIFDGKNIYEAEQDITVLFG